MSSSCAIKVSCILSLRFGSFKSKLYIKMNCRLSVFFSLIFLSSKMFGQTISKDWFEKDYKTDSVAGISLDKAYEILKDRVSKTVIVAVIDNGVDTEHEDL